MLFQTGKEMSLMMADPNSDSGRLTPKSNRFFYLVANSVTNTMKIYSQRSA